MLEWIDDTKVNLIFEKEDVAGAVLDRLSMDLPEGDDFYGLRKAQSVEGRPDMELRARVATVNDRKEKGARSRSRWYLFNPPPDELERRPYSHNRFRDDRYRRTDDGGGRNEYATGRRRSRSPLRSNQRDEEPIELFPNRTPQPIGLTAPLEAPPENKGSLLGRLSDDNKAKVVDEASFLKRVTPMDIPKANDLANRIELFPQRVAEGQGRRRRQRADELF